MTDMTLLAKEIIKQNKFLSLATADRGGNVWSTPLSYSVDDECNFYFTTTLDSKHIENIKKNPYVSFSIFDSTRRVSDIDGLQIKGIVGEVERERLPEIVKNYYIQVFPDIEERKLWESPYENFTLDEYPVYRFFQITPFEVHKRDTDNIDVDRTVVINIEELQEYMRRD